LPARFNNAYLRSFQRTTYTPISESPGKRLVCSSWELATPDMLALGEETKRLTALPAPGFAPQTAITVVDATLFESSAPTSGVAVAVLQQCITGTVGAQEDLDRARKRLAFIKKGCIRWPASQRSSSRLKAWLCASHRPSSDTCNGARPGPHMDGSSSTTSTWVAWRARAARPTGLRWTGATTRAPAASAASVCAPWGRGRVAKRPLGRRS
jgi:hypothetical protein